ncbi:hypothetical protein EDD16DRAFT_855361 [Pisolithus croceorrhizus]|nr:hypothetical protein EDD16DRAFT_855361 [Pisolithus croceorrhizus]
MTDKLPYNDSGNLNASADRDGEGSAGDEPPPYSSQPDTSPPRWQPQFEDLTTESLQRLSTETRKPLDPPPECFSTPTPLRIGSHDFLPFMIPSLSEKLTDGFRVLYPHGLLEKHGITRNDWVRFLEDLIIAARLSAQGRSAVGARIPTRVFTIRGPFIMSLVGTAYDAVFARGPLREVKALLAVWNESAFERRKLRVSLHVREDGGKKSDYYLLVEFL